MSSERLNRYCRRCGAELVPEGIFCHKCGFNNGNPNNEKVKQYLDCRQTKFAIYLSNAQIKTGGIVKYYFDEINQYTDVIIEPNSYNGKETIAVVTYINEAGHEVKEIRRLKIIVGDAPTAYQYIQVNNAHNVKQPKRNAKRRKLNRNDSVIAFFVVFCIAVLATGISFKNNTSNLKGIFSQNNEQEISESIIPYYQSRYYFQNLDGYLKDDFISLYKGITDFKSEINLPNSITESEAELLMTLLGYECPELFQYEHGGSYTITTINSRVTAISLSYTMPKSEYQTALDKCNSEIEKLKKATESYSKKHREKYVYDYLTDHVSYNTKEIHCENAFGALVNHKAKCDGISLAMKWIMEEMGIPNFIITGKDDEDPYGHAWNCVKLGNNYYDVDLTNDLQTSGKTMKLYGAYNVKRSWLAKQYPVSDILTENFTIPKSYSMSNSYHYNNGTFVQSGSDLNTVIHDLIDNAYFNGGEGLIQFESKADYNRFMSATEYYFNGWFYDNNYAGSYEIYSLKELNTVGIILDAY